MKRILKFRTIKSSNSAKKAKKKRTAKNKSFKKKHFLKIGSPHNTNDYLINENSSPFCNVMMKMMKIRLIQCLLLL